MILTDFLDELMPRLPGADEAFVQAEMLSAARILCVDGYAWPVNLGPLDIRADDPNIYLDPLPGDTRIGIILSVRFEPAGSNRKDLWPLTRPPVETTSNATEPRYYWMATPGEMVLSPTLSVAAPDSIYVDATVIPADSTCIFPDAWRTHFSEAMIAGVCSRMMAMQSKPWSDRNGSMLFGKQFRNHVATTRRTTINRFSQNQAQWRFPRFA